MIEEILIVAGIVGFVEALFEKWGVFGWLEKLGSVSDFKWFYVMVNCRFCLRFHISWYVTLCILLFQPFSWHIVIIPAVVSGLIWLTLR